MSYQDNHPFSSPTMAANNPFGNRSMARQAAPQQDIEGWIQGLRNGNRFRTGDMMRAWFQPPQQQGGLMGMPQRPQQSFLGNFQSPYRLLGG